MAEFELHGGTTQRQASVSTPPQTRMPVKTRHVTNSHIEVTAATVASTVVPLACVLSPSHLSSLLLSSLLFFGCQYHFICRNRRLLDDPGAAEALAPHRDRITWDAPVHQVADLDRFGVTPRGGNSKPSRFGSWKRLLDFYDHADAEGIALYGGGQSELGPGRGQIQLLAAIFHPDGPNDVAPAGWDQPDFARTGLPTSPLDPRPEATGFRRDR